MNIPRFWALTKIMFQSHIFNWFWRPRVRRRAVRTSVLSIVAPEYFKLYLPAAARVVITPVINNDANDKIFTIWLQGENNAPELVRACFNSVRKHCSQELIVLDEKTLFDYIDLPDIIVRKFHCGKIGRAHFADICRVELLYKYGGYWLDATGFTTDAIPKSISDLDFFVYMVGSVGQEYSFMQNCFIRSRRGAYLLAAWRAMILDYWIHENSSFDYFMHQLLFKTLVENDPRAREYFAKMPHIDQDPTHNLWSFKFDKFDEKKFHNLTRDAFFQKLSHNDAPRPGTFSGAVLNMYKD